MDLPGWFEDRKNCGPTFPAPVGPYACTIVAPGTKSPIACRDEYISHAGTAWAIHIQDESAAVTMDRLDSDSFIMSMNTLGLVLKCMRAERQLDYTLCNYIYTHMP